MLSCRRIQTHTQPCSRRHAAGKVHRGWESELRAAVGAAFWCVSMLGSSAQHGMPQLYHTCGRHALCNPSTHIAGTLALRHDLCSTSTAVGRQHYLQPHCRPQQRTIAAPDISTSSSGWPFSSVYAHASSNDVGSSSSGSSSSGSSSSGSSSSSSSSTDSEPIKQRPADYIGGDGKGGSDSGGCGRRTGGRGGRGRSGSGGGRGGVGSAALVEALAVAVVMVSKEEGVGPGAAPLQQARDRSRALALRFSPAT